MLFLLPLDAEGKVNTYKLNKHLVEIYKQLLRFNYLEKHFPIEFDSDVEDFIKGLCTQIIQNSQEARKVLKQPIFNRPPQ